MTAFHLGFPSPTIASLATGDWEGVAADAERRGFDCLWHSNERFYREMFVRMTVSTLATSRIGIGGAIAEPYAVHPAITAQSVATLHELSGGRAAVALGAGGSGFPMMGIERRQPARALREACTVIRGMLAGEEVTVDGETVRAHGAHLHFEAPQPPPPIWFATRGERTLEVAGEVADGALIASYAQPEQVADALALVRRGAGRSGREAKDVRVMVRVDTCVHDDPERALAGSRLMVAKLLWASYPDRRFVERTGQEVPAELEELIARRDYDALTQGAELVTDGLVRAFCWAGSAEEIADRVATVIGRTGIEEVGFWLLRAPDQSLSEALDLITERVVPGVRGRLATTEAR